MVDPSNMADWGSVALNQKSEIEVVHPNARDELTLVTFSMYFLHIYLADTSNKSQTVQCVRMDNPCLFLLPYFLALMKQKSVSFG